MAVHATRRGRRPHAPSGGPGAALRAAREGAGLTMEELARATGRSRSYISTVERGRAFPTDEFLESCEIALALEEPLPRPIGPADPERLLQAARSLNSRPLEGLGRATQAFPGPGTYLGTANVGAALAECLAAAASMPPDVLTLSTRLERNSPAPTFADGFAESVSRLLHAGWRVRHVWSVETQAQVAALITPEFLRLVACGYDPLISVSSNSTLPFHMALVPDRLVLLMAGSHPSAEIGWVHADPVALQGIPRLNEELLRRAMPTSLVRVYDHSHPQADPVWLEAISQAEQRPGNRYLMLDGFPAVSEPIDVFRSRARDDVTWGRTTAEDRERLEADRLARKMSFQRNISDFEFLHICPASAVDRYLQTGRRANDDSVFTPASLDQVSEHLAHLANDLLPQANFGLALVDDEFRQKHMSIWWEVKDSRLGEALFLELRDSEDSPCRQTDMEIRAASVVRKFKTRFLELWHEIPEFRKDKEWVTDQLLMRR